MLRKSKMYLNMFLVIYQILLMGTVSDYKYNKKVNVKRTFSTISTVIEELRQITTVPHLNGKQPRTRKQEELTSLLMKYEGRALSNDDKLEISIELGKPIAKKYDLFLCCIYALVLLAAFFVPFWDYFLSLSLLFTAINIIAIALGLAFIVILARFSLRQKFFLNLYFIVLIAAFIISLIT